MPKTPQPPQRYTAAETIPLAPPPDPIASLRAALRGHYEFERELGQGAFATVYLARDLKHERKVAIKVLHADPNSEMGELRFIREIRMLARLQHPNILPLHDSGHVETLLYYVMPYVSGETLRDRIDRERQISCEAACIIAREVADALAYAHAQGIIHRDIKPENILLSAGHPILADFGIARAIDIAGVRQLTRTGMGSPGTPAYMSPEQLLGDNAVDARSDTYSLGCVLYEMLAGRPPFAGKDGFVKRFTEPPPDIAVVRPDAAVVSAVLAKCMAREPADRFQTATDLAQALRDASPSASSGVGAGAASKPLRQPAAADANEAGTRTRLIQRVKEWIGERDRRLLFAAAAVFIVAALAVATPLARGLSRILPRRPLSASTVVVLPLQSGDSTLGAKVGDRFYDAFRTWNDLSVVPDTRVAQLLASSGTPTSEEQALSAAQKLGAGMLVWGTVSGSAKSARIAVHLFDVAQKASRSELVVEGVADDAQVYSNLMLQLLRNNHSSRGATGGDGLTNSYAAWASYGGGHAALDAGDFKAAEDSFAKAVGADPQYPVAHLWLAQVRAWRSPADKALWRDHALRAASAPNLGTRDKALVDALVAINEARFPDACSRYRQLTQVDSADFAGWYGLGECQYLDSLVIPSAQSPSKWAFRSSNRAAANAYLHAIRLVPAARTLVSFSRLEWILPTATTRVRLGASEGPNRIAFMASPSLMGAGESLAFVPFPAATFSNRPASILTTLSAAVAKNSAQLEEYAVQWASSTQNDPAAFEALSDVLDVRGEIGDAADPTTSALSALRRARSLSSDSAQLLRLSVKEAWLRFKRGEFGRAKKLADSALLSPVKSDTDAKFLVGLAALTGKVRLMSRLSEVSNAALPSSLDDADAALRTAASDYFARAALGACEAASISRSNVDKAIDRFATPANAASIARSVLARPLSMLVPCTGGSSILEITAPPDRLPRLQRAYAEKNQVLFHALSDSIAERVRNRRPGDLAPDFVFQQAWLRAAVGDTAGAIRQLDRSLDDLSAI
ncbi:MAG TPA: protein kinase, partial [Gemmatimonadaceae bacterium]|nr:protein kinase [Gemmatimonadaceae bacterium]